MQLWQKIRIPVISFFIAFNVFCLALILIPGFPGTTYFIRPVFKKTESGQMQMSYWPPFLPYLLATGLYQGYGVFIPRPHIYEVRLSAEITFADGSKSLWNNLEMQELPLDIRYKKERFRRWARHNVNTNGPVKWWPDTARWIARQGALNGKIPVSVLLLRHRLDTPAPGSNTISKEIHEAIFEYKVQPGDLMQDLNTSSSETNPSQTNPAATHAPQEIPEGKSND